MKHIRVQDDPSVATERPAVLAEKDDHACFLSGDLLGGTVYSETFEPHLTILNQTGGFFTSEEGAGTLFVPAHGIYRWSLSFYWSNIPTIPAGTNGVGIGGWLSEVTGDSGGGYLQHISFDPIVRTPGSPYAYFSVGGQAVTAGSGQPVILVSGGPQLLASVGASGTSEWTLDFNVAYVSSLKMPDL